MMPSESPTGVVVRRGGRALLPALSVAVCLALSTPWHHAARAGEPTVATGDIAGEPSFDLPPIVVQVPRSGSPHPETLVFKTALVFDETDEDRINDSLRLAKMLLPKIMDSVITGVQNHAFDGDPRSEDVKRVILERSAAVLKPYGVVLKSLRMERIGGH